MGQNQVIAAVSTAAGAAIGMVRLSGAGALEVAARVFRPINAGKQLSKMEGYTGCLGRVQDADGEFDEAVAFVYRGPKSYTGEDMVELSCHGGGYLMDRLLHACLQAGAKPAEPGEFTKRAFLNGKLSLDEAESVADLIASRSLQSNRAALAAKDGAVFREISASTEILLNVAAHLAAWVDFPEEDIPGISPQELEEGLHRADKRLEALEKNFRQGQILKDGVDTVIAGRPNVGKSTLMNLLSGTQKSIVTHIPGTTRDVVEETALVGEVLLRLSDTAGLRTSDDPVEQIGVQRARQRMEQCDLILAVFDGSAPLLQEDLELLDSLKDRLCIGILNKTDLGLHSDAQIVRKRLPLTTELSAQSGDGLAPLGELVAKLLGIAELDPAAPMLANQRQLDCLRRGRAAIGEAISALEAGQTFDALSVCIDDAINALQELTGERATISVVDRVFHNFCVGK